MSLYLIGVNYNTADLSKRESILLWRKEIFEFWQRRLAQKAAILLTCNRIEIYALAGSVSEALEHIVCFRKEFPGFSNNSYVLFGEKKVFSHALRLACGLESQFIGEVQILEQLDNWRNQLDFPGSFSEIFRQATVLAREIRLKSGLSAVSQNISDVVLGDLRFNSGIKGQLKIIIMGTGKLAGVFASRQEQDEYLYFAAHKNYQKAEVLAKKSFGLAISLDELSERLIDADALVSATASPHFVLKEELFLRTMALRKKELFLYDLAVPRDIDPLVKKIKGVVLKDMDDLDLSFKEHNHKLCSQVKLAEYLIAEYLKDNHSGEINADAYRVQK